MTRRVAGKKAVPSWPDHDERHLAMQGSCSAIAHCMPSSCVSCKESLTCRFFLPCEIFARCRFPRARAADAASAFPLSLRVRGPKRPSSSPRTNRAAGPAKRGREACRTGGAKDIKPMLGRSCALRDFAHSESLNFASCKKRFYVEKLEEKSCLIREHFFRGDSPLIRQQSLIREHL